MGALRTSWGGCSECNSTAFITKIRKSTLHWTLMGMFQHTVVPQPCHRLSKRWAASGVRQTRGYRVHGGNPTLLISVWSRLKTPWTRASFNIYWAAFSLSCSKSNYQSPKLIFQPDSYDRLPKQCRLKCSREGIQSFWKQGPDPSIWGYTAINNYYRTTKSIWENTITGVVKNTIQ